MYTLYVWTSLIFTFVFQKLIAPKSVVLTLECRDYVSQITVFIFFVNGLGVGRCVALNMCHVPISCIVFYCINWFKYFDLQTSIQFFMKDIVLCGTVVVVVSKRSYWTICDLSMFSWCSLPFVDNHIFFL